MRVARVFLMALFVVCVCGVAEAQWDDPYTGPDNDTDSGGATEHCGEINPYEACYAQSGKFYSCNAKGSWGGYCVVCTTDLRTGKIVCAAAQYSAACKCNWDTGACRHEGSCTYQR